MSGLATYVLPVEKIPEQLIVYVKTIIDTGMPPAPPVPDALSAMRRIMMLLRTKTGNDFSLSCGRRPATTFPYTSRARSCAG